MGAERADVVIVGGGYCGLWAALMIKERDPSCEVVVIEARRCGHGASGRNGGFAVSWWPRINSLISAFGVEGGKRLAELSEGAVTELINRSMVWKLNVDLAEVGWLWVATTRAQEGRWRRVLETCEALDADVFDERDQTTMAATVPGLVQYGGVIERTAAVVQPAALAVELKRRARDTGIRIYEGSPAIAVEVNRHVRIVCQDGDITADRCVLAGNAWMAGLREVSREIAVIASDIAVTEPLRDNDVPWSAELATADVATMVTYFRRVKGDRLIFGKAGGALAYDGHVSDDFERIGKRQKHLSEELHRILPTVKTNLAHAWTGPVDRSRDGLPIIRWMDHGQRVLISIGWSGNGVAPLLIGGKIAASLVLETEDEWRATPLANRKAGRFPPEPLKYVGGRIVRQAVHRKEAREAVGRRVPIIAKRLSALAPGGLGKEGPRTK